PVLGLIFLKYADDKVRQVATRLEGAAGGSSRRRRAPGPTNYRAEGPALPICWRCRTGDPAGRPYVDAIQNHNLGRNHDQA
ncbi:MAG: hypothetical protein KDI79_15705, partial [Anaerolineae bacterium]|nr:hypothetical protein [Anaerolineae bacterium]